MVYVSPANDVVVVRHGWRHGLEPAQWSARARRIADHLAKPTDDGYGAGGRTR